MAQQRHEREQDAEGQIWFRKVHADHATDRFWGWRENAREVEMDMREMVDRVKRKEPLYGESSLSPYHQGVAARNSRYSQTMLHAIPMFNFVNHNQVCSGHE